ncbi:TlpA disulfide reductase family protein [Lutibaculum baratangense]|uniref:Putative thiol:disulfide interchange protein n=1 Tax=Lutibaculum baratangense AMV1 TaxID=631454 RepID=V4TNH2_9HYPH|nr:TlpA disulfide reductase family protein [Lutibaculum baratangense]ESR27258.1 putative thiol:disulfide interchange protein [Lutibaculum baratangense AMV1]
MGAVTLGPLVFDAERLAAMLGIGTFLGVASAMSWRLGPELATWSWRALLIGLVGARLGHVLVHWPSFVQEPLRALAFWQGGFFAGPGLLLAGLTLFVFLPSAPLRWSSVAPFAAGLLVWSMAWQLTAAVDARGLPDQSFATLRGESYRFDASGPPLVVNLWASWCPPCRREMPMMAEVAASAPHARFVFANQGESRDKVAGFLSAERLEMDTVLIDTLGQISFHYETPGLPATLFINPDGTLRDVHLGEISREVLVEKIARIAVPREGVPIADVE